MLRKLCARLTVLALLLVLAACEGDDERSFEVASMASVDVWWPDSGTVPTFDSYLLDGSIHIGASDGPERTSTMADAGAGNAQQPAEDGGDAYDFELPAHFPEPRVPVDNSMTAAKVELGRHLFYDERLSRNQSLSCASCHKQELAFSDERASTVGASGQHTPRSSMSLANVAYSPTLTWANPLLDSFERQMLVPLLNNDPVELGLASIPAIEAILRGIDAYRDLFAAAYPEDPDPISFVHMQHALASFQRSLISSDSPYDRFVQGDRAALSRSAQRGMEFFFRTGDGRFACSSCHGGFNFSDHVTYVGAPDLPPPFHQTGLYDVDGLGGYPVPNTGVYGVTLVDADMGKFKAPTLRNIALTAPYMHDGSIATLGEVIDHYAQGGRARVAGRTDPLLTPFAISEEQRTDLVAFLMSLTDETFLTEPRYANPWPPRALPDAGTAAP